jgi:hypothetical protein
MQILIFFGDFAYSGWIPDIEFVNLYELGHFAGKACFSAL